MLRVCHSEVCKKLLQVNVLLHGLRLRACDANSELSIQRNQYTVALGAADALHQKATACDKAHNVDALEPTIALCHALLIFFECLLRCPVASMLLSIVRVLGITTGICNEHAIICAPQAHSTHHPSCPSSEKRASLNNQSTGRKCVKRLTIDEPDKTQNAVFLNNTNHVQARTQLFYFPP